MKRLFSSPILAPTVEDAEMRGTLAPNSHQITSGNKDWHTAWVLAIRCTWMHRKAYSWRPTKLDVLWLRGRKHLSISPRAVVCICHSKRENPKTRAADLQAVVTLKLHCFETPLASTATSYQDYVWWKVANGNGDEVEAKMRRNGA